MPMGPMDLKPILMNSAAPYGAVNVWGSPTAHNPFPSGKKIITFFQKCDTSDTIFENFSELNVAKYNQTHSFLVVLR